MTQVGELRRSQLITTFGIGSLVNVKDFSVMILGQEFWDDQKLEIIREERLEKQLDVKHFMQPKPTRDHDANIPCIRFPRWSFCPNCRIFSEYTNISDSKMKKCSKCRTVTLVPSRIVIACKNGHIDDFPWSWWLHKGEECENSKYLLWLNTGKGTTLSSIVIKCKGCGKQKSLKDIFAENTLKNWKCRGRQLWLGKDVREDCDQEITAVQRNSVSVYFPIQESSISIPPFSKKIYEFIRYVEKLLPNLKNKDEEKIRILFESHLESYSEKYSLDDVMHYFLLKNKYKDNPDSSDLKIEEYNLLSNLEKTDLQDEFYGISEKIHSDLKDYISKIVLIHKLREVRVLKTFKRVDPNSSFEQKLSLSPQNWLPAMEVKGEGIFIQVCDEKIRKWKQEGNKKLQDRVNKIEAQRQRLLNDDWSTIQEPVTPELLLIHTLSHLLIQQLTLECGYTSSSLRERLYVRETKTSKMNGFLIYTATSDSSGSFGGLVRQGAEDRFCELFYNTLENSKLCSNDPLCFESMGQGNHSLNLAACYACCLIPEMSCEIINRNSFLDRAVVVDPEIGFFRNLIN